MKHEKALGNDKKLHILYKICDVSQEKSEAGTRRRSIHLSTLLNPQGRGKDKYLSCEMKKARAIKSIGGRQSPTTINHKLQRLHSPLEGELLFSHQLNHAERSTIELGRKRH